MQVVFGTLAKRRNSTKQLSGGTSYACKLKDSSSSLSPVIALQWPGTGNPCAYNVCYIPDYGRYYYVDNWTYSERQWLASCTVDVLASFKTEIGAAQKYILRADITEDPKIMDSKYPPVFPLTNATYALTGAPTQWATDFSGGRYIVNVVGNGNTYTAAGGSYYALTALHLQGLINACFTETESMWQTPMQPSSDFADALNQYGEKMSKSIHNPAQFINGIYWVPFVPPSSPPGSVITLGQVPTGVVGDNLLGPIHKAGWACQIAVDALDACWKQVPPYATYTLHFPPFGSFELDARQIWEAGGTIGGYVITDMTNGESILECYAGTGLSVFMFAASARLGTPIQISGSSVNYANLAQTQLNAAGGVLNSLLRGDIGSAILGGASGIISSAQAGAASATNGGYSGGLAAMQAFRGVVKSYMTVPTEDPAEMGVPVLDKMTISYAGSLGALGFVQCADGDIEAPATSQELEQISAFLTGGFFYE